MTTSDQNALLDHNGVLVTFIASENAETMEGVFWGTEEEVERTYAAVSNIYCKLNNVLFVAHVKRWLHDGKGLMAYKSVSVVFICLHCSLRSWHKTVDVMPESK